MAEGNLEQSRGSNAPAALPLVGAVLSDKGVPAAESQGFRVTRITSAISAAVGAAPGAPGVWQARRRELGPRLVFLLAAVLILGSLCVMLFPGLTLPLVKLGKERHESIDQHFALLVLIACLLPPLLAWLSYLLINKRAVCQQVRPRFPAGAGVDPAVAELAASTWAYEMGKAQWSLSRAEVFAGMWGMIATVSIVGAITFLLPPFHRVGGPFHGPHSVVAMAVIGTTSTSFLLDLARLCIRTANDDATKRMFAEALRTLILSVVSTLALVLLVRLVGPEPVRDLLFEKSGVESCLVALGIGAGVAVLGPPAFEWIQGRVGAVLGINGKKAERGTPLDTLDDIGDSEIARLAEEGIESVEALVSAPVPRLFLNTRFSLQRIADWQDTGLLITRVGATAAADLRARWGVCGAAEIRRVINDPAERASAEALRGIFKKNLRVDGDAEADLVLQQIARDERVALTQVMRQTLLESRGDGRD
jgi:hypothetical protein